MYPRAKKCLFCNSSSVVSAWDDDEVRLDLSICEYGKLYKRAGG